MTDLAGSRPLPLPRGVVGRKGAGGRGQQQLGRASQEAGLWSPLTFNPRTRGRPSCSCLSPKLSSAVAGLLGSPGQIDREKNSAKIITVYNKSMGTV